MRLSPSAALRPDPEPWTIRPLTDADWAALLQLNAESRPAVAAIDASDLPPLLERRGHHFVAVAATGEVLGYLLSFPRESDFDDTEINELRRRLAEPFLYIAQVVIARAHRRRRIGGAFYAIAVEIARRHGLRLLCCDVNTDPPNPESFAFHRAMGFSELGHGIASNGIPIAFLVRSVEGKFT